MRLNEIGQVGRDAAIIWAIIWLLGWSAVHWGLEFLASAITITIAATVAFDYISNLFGPHNPGVKHEV